MTITFRPTVQLSYSMLLAACSSSAAIRPSFDRRFLLCGIPPPAADQPSQLAVWDGSSLLVVNLLPGVDPSQHVIDQTINARAHLLHGDTKRRLAHQQEQERLQALRFSVVQRLPEAPGEEGPAAAGLLSCAAGPSVLQVLLEAPDAEAEAAGGWRLAAGVCASSIHVWFLCFAAGAAYLLQRGVSQGVNVLAGPAEVMRPAFLRLHLLYATHAPQNAQRSN
jgi:hypothetical protein